MNGIRGLVGAIVLAGPPLFAGAGCDSDPAAPFLGTWSQVQSFTATCDDGTGGTSDSASQVSVARGTYSDLLRTTVSQMACPLPLDISGAGTGGKTAQLHTGTQCSMMGAVVAIDAWSLTVADDNRSAAETGTGSIRVLSGTCAVQITTTLTR